MAAPAKTSRTKRSSTRSNARNASTTATAGKTKRALKDVTNKKSSKASTSNIPKRRNNRALPLQRGKKQDDVGFDVYIQEKKDKTKTLHPATLNDKTSKYYYTPKGETKPIVFDGRKHVLVKKEAKPLGSSIKEKLEASFEEKSPNKSDLTDSEDDDLSVEEEEPKVASKSKTTVYEDTESESSSDEEDDEDSSVDFSPVKQRTGRKKNTTRRGTARNDTKKSPPKRKRPAAEVQTQPSPDSASDSESSLDEPPTKKFKRFDLEESNGDWRAMSVIDY